MSSAGWWVRRYQASQWEHAGAWSERTWESIQHFKDN